jgi:hypothetical protein
VRSSLLARIKHHLEGKSAGDSDILLFPNVSFHTIKDTRYWYSLSFHPASERKTLIRYDLYCFQSTDGDANSQLISDKLIEMITGQVTELGSQYQLQARGAEDGSQGGVIETTTEDRDFRSLLGTSSSSLPGSQYPSLENLNVLTSNRFAKDDSRAAEKAY